MNYKISLFNIIAAAAVVNTAGLLLKYFELENYIILLGFRFHLSLCIPFIIIFRREQIPFIKEIFAHPLYKNNFPFVIFIFLPLLILISLLFLFYNLRIGDPDYFYELGISSIADYPIYLIWNSIQLIMLLLFLIISSERFRFKLFYLITIIPLLFVYEFIPVKKEAADYFGIITLIISAISVSFLLKYFQNIYWAGALLFSIFWSNILAFGSGSNDFIHLLLAARYDKWDGLLIVHKNVSEFLLQAHFLILLLFILFSSGLKKDIKKNL